MSVDYTTPTSFGPGMWATIHILSFNANTKSDQIQFIKTMKIIVNNIPCETCRGHAKEYVKTHKMEEFLNEKGYGMFMYTWKFHNTVNQRLGKPIMSYDMAFHRYNQLKNSEDAIINIVTDKKSRKKSVCSKECTDADDIPKKDKLGNQGKKLYMLEKENDKKNTKKHYIYDTDKYYKKKA